MLLAADKPFIHNFWIDHAFLYKYKKAKGEVGEDCKFEELEGGSFKIYSVICHFTKVINNQPLGNPVLKKHAYSPNKPQDRHSSSKGNANHQVYS